MKTNFISAAILLIANFSSFYTYAQDSTVSASVVHWDVATAIAYAKQNNIQVNIVRLDEKLSEPVSVTERTKEIGLRMSIGARGIDILMQFLIEAIVISITGGVLGVLLGLLASKLITVFLSWPTLVSESSIVLSFVVCAITGIFFGYYPAQKASRLDPIEALRYE